MKIIRVFLILFTISLIYFIFSVEHSDYLPTYHMEVHFINMGRNDAILIKDNDSVIVIDGGSYQDGDTIVEYLQKLDITHIDAIIGSHIHFNHIQSHAKLLQNFTVSKMFYAHELELCLERELCEPNDIRYILDEINYQEKKISLMEVNDVIKIGNMEIEVLGPIEFGTFEEHRFPQNFNSLNFILTFKNTRFFFTGDGMQEENILEKFYDKDLRVSVFQHPYHGEQRLSREFIERVSPDYVIETHHTSQIFSGNRRDGEYYSNLGSTTLYFNTDENIIFISNGNVVSYKRSTLELVVGE